MARWGVPCARTACWCCRTKAYPDSGWAPPAHRPIQRTGGTYQTYAPMGGYGNMSYGPGAPMVYQPTDTTQFGYSYANTPRWQANPNKIPRVPNPSNFHTRACPHDPRCGGCNTGCLSGRCMPGGYSGGNCMNGQCMPGNVTMGHTAVVLPPPGFVRMMQYHRPVQQMQPVGLPVKSIQPVSTPEQKIQTVSRSVVEQPTVQEPQPEPVAVVKLPAVKESAQPKKQPVQPKQVQQRKPGSNRHAGRRTASRRPQPRKSGGWFGLPSLREMTF